VLKYFLAISPIPWLIRELVQRNKVTILTYHELSPAVADKHFKHLNSKYNIITLKDYLSSRKTQTMNRLPPKALIITIDDGHKSNYALLEIFHKHRIKPTIFLCSGIVGSKRHFWWKNISKRNELQKLKKVSNKERLRILAQNGFEERRLYKNRQALSEDEILNMKNLVDFQSHTIFHPILPQCSIEQAKTEICGSKLQLEEKYRTNILALAYPNGDYSEREIAIAIECGYECALTLDPGFNSTITDMYKMKRFVIPDDAEERDLILRSSGVWDYIKKKILCSRLKMRFLK